MGKDERENPDEEEVGRIPSDTAKGVELSSNDEETRISSHDVADQVAPFVEVDLDGQMQVHTQASDLELMASLLDPPPSKSEQFRDNLLRILDEGFFQVLGIIVLILVVVDGAIFFFFLMGWHTLCRPRTACEPRDNIYNVSVHILNGLFTYMATVSMPWRCVNFMHSSGWCMSPYRLNDPGCDLYGLPTMDIWFHIPRRKRLHVLVFLLFNCIFQYVNQAMRIVYWSYNRADRYPGNLLVNVFFGASFLFAAIGGVLLLLYTGQMRKQNPGKFGPGPKDLLLKSWRKYVRRIEEDSPTASRPALSLRYNHPDPTRANDRWEATGFDRPNMRLFAM